MKLYLSSYRLGNNIELLKEWVKNNKKMLVIPNALDIFADGERKSNGINDKCEDLHKLGFETEILDLRKYFNNKNGLRDYLKSYNSFYVLGGNVFVLRQAMKLSGFDKYLLEISNNPNYLYSGFSAGICVLAKDLHGIHLADDETQKPYGDNDTVWQGVGLIDYMPVPHFDTPNHPESHLMNGVVDYLQKNNLRYKTLKDGEVIVEDLMAKSINLGERKI